MLFGRKSQKVGFEFTLDKRRLVFYHEVLHIFREQRPHIYPTFGIWGMGHWSLPYDSSVCWYYVAWPHSNGIDFCGNQCARMCHSISSRMSLCQYQYVSMVQHVPELVYWTLLLLLFQLWLEPNAFHLHLIRNFRHEQLIDDTMDEFLLTMFEPMTMHTDSMCLMRFSLVFDDSICTKYHWYSRMWATFCWIASIMVKALSCLLNCGLVFC